MSSRLVITGALLGALLTACSGEDEPLTQWLPQPTSDVAASTATTNPVPTAPEASPTCAWPDEVSATGSGFVVEWSITSGRPNPAWRLTKAEGAKLRLLLTGNREVLDLEGPDDMGGFGVTADGATTEFLERREIPSRFWVRGDNQIGEFLSETFPC
ncbi:MULTISPECIES: hypothetical protein [unclassified Nocardioides]|uniref:hypothetical protein n=1 Tax=unclassified Nocardioides TaxID=2615069 RepID=UPI0006F4009D|nr:MULTISPECIES: hypothetical protein [unclassified Nocardioides]KRA32623.1 hypothetical protein ASD81_13905 [Nocardioides sp. Root614]KRA89276.1 hypothetical protein ASD84_14170 [Nocardioides sp. Root682]